MAKLTDPLSRGPYRRLWMAALVSGSGSSIHSIAVIWVAYEISSNAWLVSIVALAVLVPDLALSVPAGTILDRVNRRSMMIVADMTRFFAVGSIPLISLFGPDQWLLPTIVAAAFIEGVMAAFATPARSTLLPKLIPEAELDVANALLNLTTSSTRIFYIIGGGILALVGSTGAFAINAVSFLIAGILVLTIPAQYGRIGKREQSTAQPSVIAATREGLQYIASTPLVRSVVFLSAVAGLAVGPLGVVLPFYLEEIYASGSTMFGLFYGAIAIGMIFGSLGTGLAEEQISRVRGRFMIGGLLVAGLAISTLGVVSEGGVLGLSTGLIAMGLFGVSIAAIQVPGRTLMHSIVPEDRQGRVFAVIRALAISMPAVAIAGAGFLIESVGVIRTIQLEAIILFVGGVLLLFSPLRSAGDQRGYSKA